MPNNAAFFRESCSAALCPSGLPLFMGRPSCTAALGEGGAGTVAPLSQSPLVFSAGFQTLPLDEGAGTSVTGLHSQPSAPELEPLSYLLGWWGKGAPISQPPLLGIEHLQYGWEVRNATGLPLRGGPVAPGWSCGERQPGSPGVSLSTAFIVMNWGL